MKPNRYLWTLLFLALAAIACRAAERAFDRSPEAVVTVVPIPGQRGSPSEVLGPTEGTKPDAGAADTPLPAQTESGIVETSLPAGKPPQSQAAEIRPAELRSQLTRLSALIGYQVLDREGAILGTVSDFIVNTCETYLVYFLLNPAEGLGVTTGSRIVAPFEVITINSGVFDAKTQTIQLSLAAAQFKDAPAFQESQVLVPVDWESGVREYWSKIIRVSSLTTGCRVTLPEGGATEIHKVAYASELIGAALRDRLQNPLGLVEEAILEPESGKLSFFVVHLSDGQGLALVPLRVVNIPEKALAAGAEVELVLLVKKEILLGAPRINTLEEAVQGDVQASARAYWNR